ncbi:serine/threonine-protein kinase nekl-2-like [Penaeus japonicus]|uniref:serine/threonine-protein kinase nekl-2-like n=1 Tax=Penaeus japonicus TaxID=27405 RepID=UPI001C70CAD5|nr:serine/threonine-protein kinase nekl-2-like [Penaeus japonicus]
MVKIPKISGRELQRLKRDGKFLGEGITAKAYLVTMKKGRQAVLKVCQDQEFDQSFEMEIDILQRLNGVAGAPLLLGVCRKPMALAMEYCEGSTMLDLVNSYDISNKTLLEVALQVVREVHKLHQKGFAHNDMKTDNCIIDMTTTPATVRLIDFGTCTALGQSPGYSCDPEGMHLAPELCRLGSATTAAEVFSLGCLLEDLVTGREGEWFPTILHQLVDCARRQDPEWRPSMTIVEEVLEQAVSEMAAETNPR